MKRYRWIACLAAAMSAQIMAAARPACMAADFVPPATAQASRSALGIEQAVARVQGQRGAGSGTLVWKDGTHGVVLTAAHVVQGESRVTVVWHTGQSSLAVVLASDGQLDVAALKAAVPNHCTAIPLAGETQWPRKGDTVELIGFGGGRFRHWQATVNGYAPTAGTGLHQTLSVATQTIGGDSGGAIVFQKRLVGVIWGGPLAGPGGPMIATHGTCCVAIRRFLARVAPQTINQRSEDAGAAPARQDARCPSGFCPRMPRTEPPPAAPPAEAGKILQQLNEMQRSLNELRRRIDEAQAPEVVVDYDHLAGLLTERILQDERFRGPPGRDGQPGRDGSDGQAPAAVDLDLLADQVKQRLAGSIRVRVEPVTNPR